MRNSPTLSTSRPGNGQTQRSDNRVSRLSRLDAEARAELLAELERRMGVKPILGRTGLRPGY